NPSHDAAPGQTQLRSALTGPTRLQARLHMPPRLRGDHAALLHAVALRPDDLQVQRARVPCLVQDADVADQVDVSPAVGLVLRLAGALLPALAVPDVDVLHAGDHLRDRFHRVLPGAPDVRGIHVDPER